MNGFVKFTLSALIASAMFAAVGIAETRQPVVQGGVVGTWMLVSETAHQQRPNVGIFLK